MLSPHPDTAMKVAEAARRERLARMAGARRHPSPVLAVWARFRAGAVMRRLVLPRLGAGRDDAAHRPSDRVGGVPARTQSEG